ncbi:hypothetical protein BASA62_004433 [Batrachochytrium salamandrivorans]|nr:hypothetical protein BASA62_004433 [Batrachochytrium salamandrivorans]
MQFFYLLSFVVVASYAAALPQPAGLSEKYSNNVDITLASILEARSYQPVSNTREDSPTLMSLERRADSAGSPRLPRSTNVGDGFAELSENGEKVGNKIGGAAGAYWHCILEGYIYTGTVIQNVEEAIQLLVEALDSLVKLFDVIKTLMSKSESGRTIYDDISTMMESLDEFIGRTTKAS